jgi:subtilisin family serine protease
MSRRTKLACGVTAVSVALAVAISPLTHATVTAAAQTSSTAVQAPDTWVTLVTGDRVLVRTTHGRTGVVVDPATRAGLMQFQQFTMDGDQYVLPTDAAALVRDGVLDRQLFNVTGLVRQGYDDAHAARVPLLVRYANTGTAKSAAAPVGAAVRRTLGHVAMKALDEKKGTAAWFWDHELTNRGKGMLARGRRLAGGIQRVWLNATVQASLDVSVPQIGAPSAWSRGLTGSGVTVAVLDTGIDANHPDFAGRVGPTKDFSGKGNVDDGSGHGTHVASIVAGSGAAADGTYKGVAPQATLAIGKVLDDAGEGSIDAVIAGMEWAASQSGAKIVNMSLGSRDPSDGTDPISAALNDLTNEYGTLFVAAAGNSGGDKAVATPAAADKALAVGSVSKKDVLSEFSSRGPRLGDGAVKPELAAPGEDIVAAFPAGGEPLGEPVGDAYQRLSGTSMAAPHVTGSAALLAPAAPGVEGGSAQGRADEHRRGDLRCRSERGRHRAGGRRTRHHPTGHRDRQRLDVPGLA